MHSRNTQNFLNSGVAQLAKLKIEDGITLQVIVANGRKLLSQGKCENIVLKLQRKKFSVSFHVLTLGGSDIVLGVQGLKMLGPIMWEFLSMTMQF